MKIDRYRVIGILTLAFGTIIGSVGIQLQVAAQTIEAPPAQMYEGTCDWLEDVVDSLTEVEDTTSAEGTTLRPAERVGPETALDVVVSTMTSDIALSDLLAAEHAIVVAEVGDDLGSIMVCGVIGGLMTMQMSGMLMPGDELVVGLAGQAAADVSGSAVFSAAGGSKTMVTVYLTGIFDRPRQQP